MPTTPTQSCCCNGQFCPCLRVRTTASDTDTCCSYSKEDGFAGNDFGIRHRNHLSRGTHGAAPPAMGGDPTQGAWYGTGFTQLGAAIVGVDYAGCKDPCDACWEMRPDGDFSDLPECQGCETHEPTPCPRWCRYWIRPVRPQSIFRTQSCTPCFQWAEDPCTGSSECIAAPSRTWCDRPEGDFLIYVRSEVESGQWVSKLMGIHGIVYDFCTLDPAKWEDGDPPWDRPYWTIFWAGGSDFDNPLPWGTGINNAASPCAASDAHGLFALSPFDSNRPTDPQWVHWDTLPSSTSQWPGDVKEVIDPADVQMELAPGCGGNCVTDFIVYYDAENYVMEPPKVIGTRCTAPAPNLWSGWRQASWRGDWWLCATGRFSHCYTREDQQGDCRESNLILTDCLDHPKFDCPCQRQVLRKDSGTGGENHCIDFDRTNDCSSILHHTECRTLDECQSCPECVPPEGFDGHCFTWIQHANQHFCCNRAYPCEGCVNCDAVTSCADCDTIQKCEQCPACAGCPECECDHIASCEDCTSCLHLDCPQCAECEQFHAETAPCETCVHCGDPPIPPTPDPPLCKDHADQACWHQSPHPGSHTLRMTFKWKMTGGCPGCQEVEPGDCTQEFDETDTDNGCSWTFGSVPEEGAHVTYVDDWTPPDDPEAEPQCGFVICIRIEIAECHAEWIFFVPHITPVGEHGSFSAPCDPNRCDLENVGGHWSIMDLVIEEVVEE